MGQSLTRTKQFSNFSCQLSQVSYGSINNSSTLSQSFTFLTITECHLGSLQISKVSSPFSLQNQILSMVKINLMSQNLNLSFQNLPQSIPTKHFLLLLSSFQKTWHPTHVYISFCNQNPISCHYISNSASSKSPQTKWNRNDRYTWESNQHNTRSPR